MSRMMMATSQFQELDETTGTIQNISECYFIEIADEPTAQTGLVLAPGEGFSWEGQTMYVRTHYTAATPVEVRILPFAQGGSGGGGGGGSVGPRGPRGYTFTPSVSSDGTLSWTNDGNLPNPSPVNIKGEDGDTIGDWVTGTAYTAGQLVIKDGQIYRCTTAHTAGTWSSDTANWEQISGLQQWTANTTYLGGSLIYHGGKLYVTNGTYTSGATFSDSGLTEISGGIDLPAWTPNTAYNAGDLVVYNQTVYKVTTAHTSPSAFSETNLSRFVAGEMVGATASTNGTRGLVPAPSAGDEGKVLFGDGTWGDINAGDSIKEWQASTAYNAGDLVVYNQTLYKVTTSHTSGATFSETNLSRFVAGEMTGATASAGGTRGIVPASSAGDENKFLCADGTWREITASVYATKRVLWEGASYTTGDVLTLSDQYGNYDYLIFYLVNSENAVTASTITQPTRDAVSVDYTNISGTHFLAYCYLQNGNEVLNSGVVALSASGNKLAKIEGIKFASGGANGKVLEGWQANTAYTLGDIITHDGTAYLVNTSYTSGATFSDTNLTAIVSPVMRGATSSANGESGMVPQPTAGDEGKALFGDGTWKDIPNGISTWTANTAYTAGDLVVYDQTLYKVTASHTSGATFSETNLSKYVAGEMAGATSAAGGARGIVPAPSAGDEGKVLFGDGTWKALGGSGVNVITDTLFEGSAGSFSGSVSANVPLSKSYKDYDLLGFYITFNHVNYDRYEYRAVPPAQIDMIVAANNTVSMVWGYSNNEDYADISYGTTGTNLVMAFNKAVVTKIVGIKFVNNSNYSTTEQRIGTWIDGKPLYQKTIPGTTPSGTSGQQLFANVSSLGIDKCVNIDGFIHRSDGTGFPINTAIGAQRMISTYMQNANTDIYMKLEGSSVSDIISQTAYVTLKYTKT